VQQELLRDDIEIVGHNIRNLWNISHRVTLLPRYHTSSQQSEIYHKEYLQNMRVQIEPPHQSKIIYHNARDAKRTSAPRGTVHTDEDAWYNVARRKNEKTEKRTK
jgi:hypothetical protein